MSVKCRIMESGYCEITQYYKAGVHNGMDLVNQGYTLGWIVAHSDGVVVQAEKNCNYNTYPSGPNIYGNFVKIKHDDGYYTLYGHIAYNTIPVNVGDRVKKGQRIGYMGNTGYSNGGHVHWEVRNQSDTRINPYPYLDADLPNGECTGVITYQAYTNEWLPEVHKADNTDDGFAGIGKEAISGYRCKPQYGEVIYQAKLKGGDWLEPVNSKDYSSGGANSYAGIYGKPIDCIKIKSTKGWVKYRVKTVEDGWLPWVLSTTESGTESYAGIPNHTIIGIQMY